ncbi:MAG: ATP-binding protein [Candidatus Rokuibacteriota bacterium]
MSARAGARMIFRSKYDYRAQWVSFTRRLYSCVTLDELAPKLVDAVMDAIGATGAILYLSDAVGLRAAAAVGTAYPAPVLGDDDHALIVSISGRRTPLVLEHGWRGSTGARAFAEGSVVVPLRWRDEPIGALVIAGGRGGGRYTGDDLELMEAVGEQAAGLIVTARLSESRARSREFEAFHRFTAFVAHDLKNSITALSMLSENALKNFDDREFQRDALTTVAQTVNRMKALLGRLRETPAPAALRLEPVDLATLARDAASPVVRSDRIRLVTELATLSIAGDAEALTKVIQNLVTNAVQSIDGRGTVVLRTYAEDGRAVVSVTDTGCGMSDEFVRTSLFAPSSSTKQGGWGIGLYHVKGLVEAHGGTIDVSSRQGSGTTFAVRLPIGGRT